MHNANDTSAVDTLANFESAVRSSRLELEREQQRYETLVANVKASEERVRESRRTITEVTDRCELLENECHRITHANDQQRAQIDFYRSQTEQLSAPRMDIEKATATTNKAMADTRKDLCKGTMRATADVLASVRDHNPSDLKARLAAREVELTAAKARVEKYRGDLARCTAAASAASDATNADATKTTAAAADDNDNASIVENRHTLAAQNAKLEAQLAAKRADNATRMADLTALRDALRPRIRAYGQSMPMAEQMAQSAEQAYHDLLDSVGDVVCKQCGSELGFEPLPMNF